MKEERKTKLTSTPLEFKRDEPSAVNLYTAGAARELWGKRPLYLTPALGNWSIGKFSHGW